MYIECTLRGLLTVFFRQRTKFMAVFAAVVCLGMVYVATLKPVYEAEGSMLMKFGQGVIPEINRPNAQKPVEFSHDDRNEIIQSNIKIMYSNNLLEDVVKTIGADRLYAGSSKIAASMGKTPEQVAAERLSGGDLNVLSDSKSNFLIISVRNKDATVAKEAADVVMDKFIIKQSEVYNAPQTSFLQQQVTAAKEKLDIAQKAFQQFKQDTGISDLNGEMDQQIKQKSDLSNTTYSAVTNAQEVLAKLENEKALSLSTYRETSLTVKRMNEGIAAAKAEVDRLQNELNATGDQNKSGLSKKIAAIDERLAYLEEKRGAYSDLEQQVKLNEESYKYYQQRIEEAHVNDMLTQQNITRISIVDRPTVPNSPVPLHRKLVLLAILMTATLFGLGTALAFELLDDRLAYPEQVSALLNLPLLASFDVEKAA